jgi:hypothetical protein
MKFDLLCSSMLGTSTNARSNLSRLVLPIPLYLLLPLVFHRLEWFSCCFHRLDAKPLINGSLPPRSSLSFLLVHKLPFV